MNLTKTNITLGNAYTDDVTGFTGKATAHIEYLGGENSVRLEVTSHDGREIKTEWFPVGRLSFASSTTAPAV